VITHDRHKKVKHRSNKNEEIVKSKIRLMKMGHPSAQPLQCVISASSSSSCIEEWASFKSKICVSTRTVIPCSSHIVAVRDAWSCIERNGKAKTTSSTTLVRRNRARPSKSQARLWPLRSEEHTSELQSPYD